MSVPLSWPPANVIPFVQIPSHAGLDNSVDSVAHPDGHISVRVSRADGSLVHESDFQRVKFVGHGSCPVALTWTPSRASVYLDARPLGSYDPEGRPLEIQLSGALTPGPNSVDHPDSIVVCQSWIDNRQKKFASRPPRDGRRTKTPLEQSQSLYDAARNLQAIETLIRVEGRREMIGHLAGDLRSLVYWEKDDKFDRSYNPLLFRMASKANLPLPVYGWRDVFVGMPTILGRRQFPYVAFERNH